ncbi:putative HTH-type transcriptional regulator YusO [Ascidiaceihabitans donghaensis]|uniref:Putative HTH-type transcriptional regulator YusO n=1 Tax=Ascidiaceihabitans donghaensis TaxID=1510460 RepID=A0A2R8BD83_9RHOB|nr:MarR family transcriptional regulator [Ascidiaceihabitans donghaensis]SPH21034.1 putative HTH-type transcriptional regulator YusO [Ascidiaceihabitans donghaensis]
MSNTQNFRVFRELNLVTSALFRAADRDLLAREGIRTAHQAILFVLRVEDGLTSSEIANRAGLSKTRLTGLADTLETKSLITRDRGTQDARQQVIKITNEGRAVVDRTNGWVRNLNASLMSQFDESEKAVIERFLREVHRTARDIEAT